MLLANLLAGCALVGSPTDTTPCWPEDDVFTVQPMALEGVLQADPINGVLWMRAPDGGQVDIGFAGISTDSFGPGAAEGHASSDFGLVVARAGERVSLWGGYVDAATAPRAPASPGRAAFIACSLNGQRITSQPFMRTFKPGPSIGQG